MSARHALFAAGLLLVASTAPVPALAQADEAQRHVPLDGQSNYFIGSDPDNWITGVTLDINGGILIR